MKKFLVNISLLLVFLVFQLIIPPDFIFTGVKPDLLLILIVIIGLYWGIYDGVGFAFLAGIIQGVFLGNSGIIYVAVKTLSGGLAGFMEKYYFKEKPVFPSLLVFAFTFLHETLVILLSETMLFNINYFRALRVMILPEALLNAVIAFFIYYLYHRYWQGRRDIYG